MHDLVLDVEVELAAQEAAEILVDEVVEGIARRVLVELLLEEGTLRVLLGGGGGGKAHEPGRGGLVAAHLLRRLGHQRVTVALLWVGPVLERDDQLGRAVGADLFADRLGLTQDEAPFLPGRRLSVVALLVSLHELEVHAPTVGRLERIVAEVLAALDVVLVVVGPIQLDLFALVRDGVDALLVAAQ